MTLLHVYLSLRNQRAFQRHLESDHTHSTGASASAGKSWSKPNPTFSEVNARDWLGRTALHLASVSIDTLEYVKLLLRHPAINVNVQDTESRWTALHRALYNGNLPATVLLLQREDIDTTLKDIEGNTAFDLYNSTVHGTQPSGPCAGAEVYTWGANRNAALGLGDGDDRAHPDQVTVRTKEDNPNLPISSRFIPVGVNHLEMSKLHTVVVTSEPSANVHVCGFGSGGRIGPGKHTQYTLTPLQQCPITVVSVSLGQDHTLALTDVGEVYSWGLNRFSQLGYGVEVGKLDEPIQSSPRKVIGPLRKEVVRGVAASKSASACWTDTDVFTWGTNYGQLGYDKVAQPVQVLPRKVTKVTTPVVSLCMSDSTLACLLATKDVICIWNDRSFKISFPTNVFPSEIQPYRPPQAIKSTEIAKITACDDTFAALSSNGELFTFSVPSASESEGANAKFFKPQRVWALRKHFSSVGDVAIGSDGSIIVCTRSGHVFVRSRGSVVRAAGGAGTVPSPTNKVFKFQRIPYLQRIVKVSANSTGAFGALKLPSVPESFPIEGNTMSEDLASIRPYLLTTKGQVDPVSLPLHIDDIDEFDFAISRDIAELTRLCNFLVEEKASRMSGVPLFSSSRLPYGADLYIQLKSGDTFPVHKVVLAARSSSFCRILSTCNQLAIKDSESAIAFRYRHPRVEFMGCQSLSLLILVNYLYSDEVLAVWDRRVSTALSAPLQKLGVNPAQVKSDLQVLARMLELSALADVLLSPVKRASASTMVHDVKNLANSAQSRTGFPFPPDVVLEFSDQNLCCHSTILRARSVFFASFFEEEDWTRKRRDNKGVVAVNLKHLSWHVMSFVVRYLCGGEDEEIFHVLDFVQSVDDLLEFMFDVISAANQFMLDRLVLICSSIIVKLTNISNACYILSEATHFCIMPLIQSVQGYMVANLENLLESRMLDVLDHSLVKQLSSFLRKKQAERMPAVKSGIMISQAMATHAEWLAIQDIPEPITRSARHSTRKALPPRIRPSLSYSAMHAQTTLHAPVRDGDELFVMDGLEPSCTASTKPKTEPHSPAVWKQAHTPRVSMKDVMTEAAESSQLGRSSTVQQRPRPSEAEGNVKQGSYRPPHRMHGDIFDSDASPPSRAGQPLNVSPTACGGPSSAGRPKDSVALTGETPPKMSATRGFGPIFTPSRQPTDKPTITARRSPNRINPWTASVSAPQTDSTSTRGMSFTAIQEHQLEQGLAPGSKDKRSLLEIQEEEHARRQEEEFMKWWAVEEERVRIESLASPSQPTARAKPPRKPRKPKKPSGDQASKNG